MTEPPVLTAGVLAAALSGAFDADDWGDIDPEVIRIVANGWDLEPNFAQAWGPDNVRDAKAMRNAMYRVIAALAPYLSGARP